MRVLRIQVEAPVCSFRYPHFLVGRQLSFDMPPPSTIFGHIASALGEWPDPASLRFAYQFTALGKGEDVENAQLISERESALREKDAKVFREWERQTGYQISVGGTTNPLRREFLLGARLLLYLDRLDLADAFLRPRFPVVLGRSQDLACYTKVEEVTLERSDQGYFETTILPSDFRRRTARGTTVLMPRYISPPPRREAIFDRFIVLRDLVYCLPVEAGNLFGSRQVLHIKNEPLELWIDPRSPEKHGIHRIVWFHSFTGSS